MEPEILLARLRALVERAPDFSEYTSTSSEHMIWLGQAHALISRWNSFEATSFRTATIYLSGDLIRDTGVAKILGIIQRGIADLELQVPDAAQTVFGAGEVYDFFRALNEVIDSAETSILIVDPYLDNTVFNHYLTSRKSDVTVRLLLRNNAEQVKPAAEKYIAQYGNVLEIRRARERTIHDRVVFIDGFTCWVLGQSLKDAAKAKPTYLAPLPPDVVPEKLGVYDEIWTEAEVI